MKSCWFGLLTSLVVLNVLASDIRISAEEALQASPGNDASLLIVGHPFTAFKYARQVRVLPDGKLEFLRNDRYPIRIARDAEGRLMMQEPPTDNLPRECDQLNLPSPAVCPSGGAFVVDPIARTWNHWVSGETADASAVEFPLTAERLQQAVNSTTTLPSLGPNFTDEDGKVSKADLGEREIEGIPAHGVRWTLRFDANQDGNIVHRTRIHEVWSSAEMRLILRVIDGDPNGEETVWGLEKLSRSPPATLFQPPAGYELQHHCMDGRMPALQCDALTTSDFDALHQWFAE